jgi:hypothetical protein
MTLARLGARRVALAAVAIAALGFCAIGCKKSGSEKADASDGSVLDGQVITDGQLGDGRDAAEVGPPCVAGTKAIGEACNKCNAQCASGFCVDGVCCGSACTEGCKTCAAPGTVGTCVNRPSGENPREASTCVKTAVATCGVDGTCDGSGACRKYPVNTMCKPGMCDGDAVVGSYACDGVGHCKPGATRICVPFACNPNTGDCFDTCTTSSQCVTTQQCVAGSCGKRMKGANCESNDQCASNFCADHVCCNVACQGACVSCNLMGREGTCWPIDADKPDPRNVCRDAGAASCGQTGLCDGIGSCSKYARDTQCVAPSCTGSGNRVNTAQTCDGRGTCLSAGIQECHPFACRSGACTTACNTNADCNVGIACVNGTCGPKQDGQPCQASSECAKNHCVDGVCCDQACGGACLSCSLSASLGRCTPIAAGTTDPRGMCLVKAQSTCGTNGKCDGNGGCQSWPVGTLCADETCTSNVYKAPSTCNSTGQCVSQDLVPCSPYICNGTRCFNACTNNTQCLTPFTCSANSCGLKENGASCSAGSECRSTFCAQGVCCDGACNTACKSCVAGMLGVCTNVATGSLEPTGLCAVQDPMTCGTNGKCEAGACQKYANGTACLPATCPTTTNLSTALSTCNGTGTCLTPGPSPCFPYRCGTAVCKSSCTADADCQSPAVCVAGGCGLKPNGAVCGSKGECLSNFCEQGYCCGSACTGVCKSCGLTASLGVCSNILNGDADILSRCSNQGAPSCGTDGRCDGKGACRLYDASTSCAAPSCGPGLSAQTTGRNCNGLGVCQPATTIPCAPYVCNGATACLAACTRDADCLAPSICDPQTNRCGNKARLGQPCLATTDCLTGNTCVDRVCCSTSACTLCQACNVGTSAGNCTNVPLGGADTMGRCTASPPCGNTGACNGAGACQLAATTVQCGTQSCTGSTYTPVSQCNGTGGCLAATSSSCGSYTCGGTTCRTNCSMDSHCVAPFTCQGTAPNRSCALKANGLVCTAANQCISGSCVNGVCCGGACGTCQTCNGTSPGTCTPLAAGTAAPTGQCTAAPPCGNTGTCNGASGCTQAATNVSCGLGLSCTGTTLQPASVCSGTGTCAQSGTTSCGNYICGSTTACRTNCNADAHCSSTGLYCTGNATTAGSCVPKKANGAACGAANECTIGNCVNGVCCGSATCGICQTCNGTAPGTCTPLAAGTTAPTGQCPAAAPCGNTGACNGAGGCAQGAATVACGAAVSCTGTTYQPPSSCSGTGTCNQTSTTTCGAYVCGASTCKTTCAGDGDCSTGNYCSGTSCVPKKALGTGCAAGNQCVSGSCTDGVCCNAGSCPTCQACNLSPAGTCSFVGTVTDPHGRCQNTGACGNTGACDGNGACAQQPSTLPCGAPVSCVSATYQPQSFCSGGGTCNQMSTVGCGGFVCNAAGSACLATCNNDDADCAAGFYCTGPNGTCAAKKAAGAGCGTGHECTLGNCTDNVCCATSSCSACQSCDVNGLGTCAAVADGSADPPNCGPNGVCGNTGFCSGGACAQVGANTMCASSSCPTASTFQDTRTCNGAGVCSTAVVQDCWPYACTTGGCPVTCSSDSQCVSGYCDGLHCVPTQAMGDPCSRDGECGTAHCVDNVCCSTSSCNVCQTCAASTQPAGMCNDIKDGDPDPRCPTEDPMTCGTNGTCDGAGVCKLYDALTQCATSCVSPLYVTTYCDGLHGCTLPLVDLCTLTCGPGGCSP